MVYLDFQFAMSSFVTASSTTMINKDTTTISFITIVLITFAPITRSRFAIFIFCPNYHILGSKATQYCLSLSVK